MQAAPDGGVAPKATLADLEFSGGGSQPLVRIARAGKQLALSWPDPLPDPVVNGSTAEYRGILPDVDLRMTATSSGFTELVVVKTAEAARNPALAQLTFGMSSDQLSMRENGDGSLSAVDVAGGGTVFEAPQPMMFDSSAAAQDGPGPASAQATASASRVGVSAAGEEAPPGGEEHAAAVAVAIAGDQGSLTLTPDQDLLSAPTTVYPVMIDPGITTPHAGGWAGISRANPSQDYWKFSYNSTYVESFGTGYCVSPTCSAQDVKRVLYSLPVQGQAFAGKHILSAEFDVHESFAFSCTKKPVQLWLTKKIGTGTTWNNSSSTSGTSPFWQLDLQTITDAKGRDECPAGDLEFGGTTSAALRTQVQRAADGNWPVMTLGLKASDETDPYGWKRFTDAASLRVQYNLPPKQPLMKDLTMSPGSVCQTSPISVNKWPQVTAKVFDPDGDRIGVQFAAAWDAGDGLRRRWWSTGAEATVPASTTFKASGSQFSMTLPSAVPGNTGKSLGWEARAWDGSEWGPWSSAGDVQTDCYFRIDTSIPAGPGVSSSTFPGAQDQSDLLPWTDGVGRYGTFTFATTSTDAVAYQYGLDTAPSAAHAVATTGGAAKSVSLLQQSEGPHYLSVRALDAAGNASSPTTYYFNVSAGDPQRAGWAMDDAAGAGSLAGDGGSFQATLSGAAAGGDPGHAGTALKLPGGLAADGTPADYASTPGAVVDPAGGFTVSAWVNLADSGVDRAAVSQDGAYTGGFALGAYGGQWTFKTASKDAPGFTWQTAASTQPVATGTWTHLTGVYDQAAHTQTLYVNGTPSTAVAAPSTPSAIGALQFGRLLAQGIYADPWNGSLDDVRIWNRPLTPAEVGNLAADTPLTTGVPAKAVWSMDETGTTMTGTGEAPDAGISGTVTTGITGAVDKAAHFGADSYARTGRPQVDGTRNFSVSAWVRLPAIAAGETKARMAVTQNGVHNNEFSLYYSTYAKTWVFGRYQADTSTATLISANQPACTVGHPDANGVPCIGPTTGEWTHLVGVSDQTAHQNKLYVNGYLVSTVAYTQTSPWTTPGGLQFGAVNREGANDEFFGGDIDDVRVFDRIVTAPEIQTMIQQRPQVAGRWKFNTADTATPPTSPDDLGTHPATLYGPAAISNDANIGTGALSLDGDTAYAATTDTPLRTDESFTLAGWAQTAATPTHDMTVLSLGDDTDSAATIRWHYVRTDHDPDFPDDPDLDTVVGEWQAETVADGTPRAHTVVAHSADTGQASNWTHLAVTYDALSNQLTLYVNGQTEDQVCDDEDTSGTCTQHVSFTGAVQPLTATRGLQFGRGLSAGTWTQPFSGQIDDVWACQGVLTPAQIITLHDSVELDSTGTS
ncbi:LamG domain-containing protein [Actinacidiphila epipremni]|uniref:LamG domain-containing protein n=1 Tax=Actinacidiphila epipremni TaxID=2053013 RepID=A0ABX0ZGV3_9ACTN|nr:LamG domain-containing protein [Actinacidiphila epipremni]NJP42546.1 LamG domain-containing protein [Actinacidiphila epipremni]